MNDRLAVVVRPPPWSENNIDLLPPLQGEPEETGHF